MFKPLGPEAQNSKTERMHKTETCIRMYKADSSFINTSSGVGNGVYFLFFFGYASFIHLVAGVLEKMANGIFNYSIYISITP